MATSDSELKDEVRTFGTGGVKDLSNSDIATAISRAKSHLSIEANLDSSPGWYTNAKYEDALYWTTLLFAKVASGELDSKAVAVGGIEEDVLKSREDDETTFWYRRYKRAKGRLTAGSESHVGGTSRTDRAAERDYRRD